MAGILSAQAVRNRRRPSYHQFLPLVLIGFCLSLSPVVRAQSTHRAEAILIDVSGTIGRGGNPELLTKYLAGTKQLLLTEPPESRVWVSVITTDSFGDTQPLLKGWTPASQGIFTDDLVRSRHELAATFEKRGAGLRAISAGTDIFGALWQAKDVLDSQPADQKEIWIFSDMMNETSAFPMRALLPRGTEGMVTQAESTGLVVPLKGYRVHVLGASFQGLNADSWNVMKLFWSLYFRKAGAMLVTYTPDVTVTRE